MTEEEQAAAEQIYAALMDYSAGSERSKQSAEFRIGPSDIGWCSEKVRRMLLGQQEPGTDYLTAFIGTAIGDLAERAIKKMWPDCLIQPEVEVTLVGDKRTYTFPGHPDIVDPDWGVWDGKTAFGLNHQETHGSSQSQLFQGMLYLDAVIKAGLLNIPAEDAQFGNFWIDRGGRAKYAVTSIHPYDPQVVQDAAWWLDEVVDTYLAGVTEGADIPARKEPPVEVCLQTCGFAGECRAHTERGLISDPETLARMRQYREGRALEKQGKQIAEEAVEALRGVTGTGEGYTLGWVHVNETEVKAFTKKAYDRITMKRT